MPPLAHSIGNGDGRQNGESQSRRHKVDDGLARTNLHTVTQIEPSLCEILLQFLAVVRSALGEHPRTVHKFMQLYGAMGKGRVDGSDELDRRRTAMQDAQAIPFLIWIKQDGDIDVAMHKRLAQMRCRIIGDMQAHLGILAQEHTDALHIP